MEEMNDMYQNLFGWENPGTAVVTGASAGIGAAFAKIIAKQGFNLVLIARRKEKLARLAEELQNSYHIKAEILVGDLAKEADIERIKSKIAAISQCDILINNAGFGTEGNFDTTDFQRQLDMVQVHNIAPVHFMRVALQGMVKRQRGIIINVSSVGGYLPSPKYAMYAATKSFIRMFSESVALEVAKDGVYVQALCPGFTITEFHDGTDIKTMDRSSIPKSLWMTSEEVVLKSLRAYRKKTTVLVPGFKNKLLRWAITSHWLGKLAIKISLKGEK